MYICKYIYRYSHPLPRRPSGWLYFAALASMMAKRLTEACSYAALIGLTAAIRIHCRAGPAAVVHSHCCTGSAMVCRGHCHADPAVEVHSNGRVLF
jgi:hypothetical protein